MKNKLLTCLFIITGLFMVSCTSNEEVFNLKENAKAENAVGTEEFLNRLHLIAYSPQTRTIESDSAMIPQLIEVSIAYLEQNGISYTEFCQEQNDPRIAVIAMGIAEHFKGRGIVTTRGDLDDCVLTAVGIKEIGEGSVKKIAKQIGKAVLKKAIPYVGWGLFAVDLVYCLSK